MGDKCYFILSNPRQKLTCSPLSLCPGNTRLLQTVVISIEKNIIGKHVAEDFRAMKAFSKQSAYVS